MSVWALQECVFQRKYGYGYESAEIVAPFPVPILFAEGFSCRWLYSVHGKYLDLFVLESNSHWKIGGHFPMEDMLPIFHQFGIKGLP